MNKEKRRLRTWAVLPRQGFENVPVWWSVLAIVTLAFLTLWVFSETEAGRHRQLMQRYLQHLDINQATQQQIVALPGIGPVLAKAILKKRPFHRVEDLAEVKGIGSHLLERLEPLIRAEALPTRFRFGKPVFPPSER